MRERKDDGLKSLILVELAQKVKLLFFERNMDQIIHSTNISDAQGSWDIKVGNTKSHLQKNEEGARETDQQTSNDNTV